MKLSRARITLLTFLMAAIVLWVTSPEKSSKTTTNLNQKTQEYSWETRNTTLWKVTPNQPEQQTIIQTQQFNYRNEQKSSEYIMPTVTRIDSQSISTLSSELGYSENDTLLIFDKNVNLVQQNLHSDSITRLTTEQLNYNTATQELTSAHEVEIEFDQAKTTGRGFKAQLENQHFTINHDVKSVLNPK